MKVATFAIVGVGAKLISVAHHKTVPVWPLPSVAVMTDEVVLVSGSGDPEIEMEPGVGDDVVDIPAEVSNGILALPVVDDVTTPSEVPETISDGKVEVAGGTVGGTMMDVPEGDEENCQTVPPGSTTIVLLDGPRAMLVSVESEVVRFERDEITESEKVSETIVVLLSGSVSVDRSTVKGVATNDVLRVATEALSDPGTEAGGNEVTNNVEFLAVVISEAGGDVTDSLEIGEDVGAFEVSVVEKFEDTVPAELDMIKVGEVDVEVSPTTVVADTISVAPDDSEPEALETVGTEVWSAMEVEKTVSVPVGEFLIEGSGPD